MKMVAIIVSTLIVSLAQIGTAWLSRNSGFQSLSGLIITTISNIGVGFFKRVTGAALLWRFFIQAQSERVGRPIRFVIQLFIKCLLTVGITPRKKQENQQKENQTATQGNLVNRVTGNCIINITREAFVDNNRFWCRLGLLSLRLFRLRCRLYRGLCCRDIAFSGFRICNVWRANSFLPGIRFSGILSGARLPCNNRGISCRFLASLGNRLSCNIIGRALLNFSKLGVFQLKQTLQRLHLILKVINASVELVVFPAGTFKFFHGHCGASVCTPSKLTISTGGATLSFSLAAFIIGNQKLELITTGRRFIGNTALGLLSSCGIKGTLGLLELLILLGNNASRFSTGAAANLICRRNTQHFATLQPVDVVADKRIRIQVLQGKHNLLHRQAVIRANRRRNGPECVRRASGAKRISAITGTSRLLYPCLPTSGLGATRRSC